MHLQEDGPRPDPQALVCSLKGLKISIGKNRQCGTQAVHLIKCLLAPAIPTDCNLPPACVFTRCQLMQGLDYLCELGYEQAIIFCEPKRTSDFSKSGVGGPIFDGIYLSLIGHYSLGRDNVSQICDLSVE